MANKKKQIKRKIANEVEEVKKCEESEEIEDEFLNEIIDNSDSSDSDSEIESDEESDAEDVVEEESETSEEEAIEEEPTTSKDEYEENDTSDEEDIRNTVGNVPKNWYDEYKHLGYDWDARKLIKPETGDSLDLFLRKMDDPDFWRTVKDPQTGQDVILSAEDLQIIKRIKEQKNPVVTFDEYAPWIEWFTSEIMQTPIRKFPEHKRSFLPSKDEQKKISKLVNALKMGWIKTEMELKEMRANCKEPKFYDLWTSDNAEHCRGIHKHIPAPKRQLPTHAESYNPPVEYLFDDRELKLWRKLKNAPWKRKLHFVPEKYDSLRKVPSYPRFIKERFLRCLDLYLCPRGYKMKLNIEPESLLPKLPSPRDLQPFPINLSLEFKGHTSIVRAIDTDYLGQYLVSGSDDKCVKLWEINTGRCLKTIEMDSVIQSINWCPNRNLSLILVGLEQSVVLLNPNVGDFLVAQKTDLLLKEQVNNEEFNGKIKDVVKWENCDENANEYEKGFRVRLVHFKEIKQCVWHRNGDYFASVMPNGLNRSILIHQLSKRKSQLPFNKSKGLVQCVLFHPVKPYLLVATQRHVRIYDLIQQKLLKKLLTNSKWISTMSIHPNGDNLLVGTYDRKILWFDLDLSTKPYQTIRLHGTAVRSVVYHKRYPLFASGSDDRSLIVCHGMVYNDLLKNALIVPLKRFQDHEKFDDFGIFAVLFHPYQPWVFSAGADATIKLYTN